jgi:NADPH:quinone reductase-like Zn-dependent oxidoreductase
MRAVVIANPGRGVESWALVERPVPVPGPGQIRLRVHAVSLNYRDLAIALGFYGGPVKPGLVPGADGAGVVEAVGPGVTRWKVGDRVTSTYFPTWVAGGKREEDGAHQPGAYSNDGLLAEQVVLAEGAVVRAPAHLDWLEASTLPCAGLTAWSALVDSAAAPSAGESVLVQGTGGVSLFAVQMAQAMGLRVLATSSSEAKLQRLRGMGVQETVNYRENPQWAQAVLELTGGRGVDHVVDVGGAATLPQSLQAVRVGGGISVVGILGGINQQIDPLPILIRSVRVAGISVGSTSAFERMNQALESWKLRPVVDEVFPLERAQEALGRLASQEHFGKLVIGLAP